MGLLIFPISILRWQKAGGENNAWTSNDITNYYSVVPRQNVETAFWLESDRMFGLDFSEKSLSVQKQVVIEEFKQRNLNQPYGDIPLLIRPLAYKVHPYRWPTIGKRVEHIEQVKLEDVKSFFYKHYAPNNAILAVTGNISFEEAVELTEKLVWHDRAKRYRASEFTGRACSEVCTVSGSFTFCTVRFDYEGVSHVPENG